MCRIKKKICSISFRYEKLMEQVWWYVYCLTCCLIFCLFLRRISLRSFLSFVSPPKVITFRLEPLCNTDTLADPLLSFHQQLLSFLTGNFTGPLCSSCSGTMYSLIRYILILLYTKLCYTWFIISLLLLFIALYIPF